MTTPGVLEVHGGAKPPGHRCDAVKRQQNSAAVELCSQRAGWGTDHPGVGRCKLHGGASPVRHGLYSKTTAHRLAERITRLRESEDDLLDLREQIALGIALVQEFTAGLHVGEPLDAERAKTMAGLVEAVSRNIERHRKLEHSQAFGPDEIRIVLAQVVAIVSAETDQETAAKIGRRLLAGLGEDGRAA